MQRYKTFFIVASILPNFSLLGNREFGRNLLFATVFALILFSLDIVDRILGSSMPALDGCGEQIDGEHYDK